MRKFFAIVMASGENPDDRLNQNFDPKVSESKLNVTKTVGAKMIQGDEVGGFEKAFDNGNARIYRVLH